MKMLRKWAAKRKLWQPKIITINHALDLNQRIRAGNYFHYDSDINEENFPITMGEGTEEIRLAFFRRRWSLPVTTKMALFRIQRGGGIPIGIKELLAIGEQYPNLQLVTPIVALNATCQCEFMEHSGFAFMCLYGIEGKRELGLTRCFDLMSHQWAPDYRFPFIIPSGRPKTKHTAEAIILVPQTV